MSASFFWVSWKALIGLPNCTRESGVGQCLLQAVAGGTDGAEHDAEAGLVQARQRSARPRASGSWADVGQPDVVEDSSEVTDARSDILLLDVAAW